MSACASLSNYAASTVSSRLNYILFVPLGAEGPVNCLELCTASPCSVTRLHSKKAANPNTALAARMMHLRPPTAAALFTEHSTTDKPIEIAAARSLWGGIKSVCSCLISGLDAGGINKLREERRLAHSLLSPYSLTHSLPPLLSQSLSSHSSNQLNSITANVLLEFLLPEKWLEFIHP